MDRIDRALVAALQKDGRASNKELAHLVGLAPSTTHHRVRRLFEAGVVRSVSAVVEPAPLGVHLQALIFVRLAGHLSEMTPLKAWILELPQVVGMWETGGTEDFLLHVVARDTEHLRIGVLDALARRSEIERLRTELVFDHASRPMPNLLK